MIGLCQEGKELSEKRVVRNAPLLFSGMSLGDSSCSLQNQTSI